MTHPEFPAWRARPGAQCSKRALDPIVGAGCASRPHGARLDRGSSDVVTARARRATHICGRHGRRPAGHWHQEPESTLGSVKPDPVVDSWASSPGRRRNMQANRSRDTKPELEVRRALHRLGLRYRVAIAPEPGLRRRADIVFTRARVAVFIDGCFWHGCPEHGRSSFNHNADYWPTKIAANRARDTDTNLKLAQAGWLVLRYWEHQDAADVVADIQQTVEPRSELRRGPRSTPNSALRKYR